MLNSQSTNADVFAAYDDNAAYDLNGSVSQAQMFVAACRILLRRLPKRAGNDGQQIETNADLIRRELDRAQSWIDARRSTARGGSRCFDLGHSRD